MNNEQASTVDLNHSAKIVPQSTTISSSSYQRQNPYNHGYPFRGYFPPYLDQQSQQEYNHRQRFQRQETQTMQSSRFQNAYSQYYPMHTFSHNQIHPSRMISYPHNAYYWPTFTKLGKIMRHNYLKFIRILNFF